MRSTVTILTFCVLMCKPVYSQNPFLAPYNTPHETAPFNEINTSHFEPAIKEGILRQTKEIEDIVSNPAAPSFSNTIEALERSGKLLGRVCPVFYNLLHAETNEELQALAQTIVPLLNEHSNNINLNEALFARIKEVYLKKDSMDLSTEQAKLLEETYKSFTRNGANLGEEDKKKYRELSQQLSMLTLSFNEHILSATNEYGKLITDLSRLSGIPQTVLDAAAGEAADKGEEGWLFTLHAPSYSAILKYADNRELRKELYMAYNTKCTQADNNNNIEIVKRIVNTRMEIARLLGYDNFAQYQLERRMAQTSENVYNLLNLLRQAYTPAAEKEVEQVRQLAMETEGADFQLMPWDWNYYSQKLQQRKYNFNTETLRPYLELGRVKEGIFSLANRLYGITLTKNPNIPVYHPDVDAYEVHDTNGEYLAVLYTDFYPREGKSSGGWTTSYQDQWKDEVTGEDHRPHISIVMNFNKPVGDKPALLTLDEVETFIHEFGHSLHCMFSNTTYESLSCTNVYWDFVELPSQFMENFLTEKDFLRTFAFHYQTGEPIPDELVQGIINSSNFNVAYSCLRQVGYGLLDMAWYTRSELFDGDVEAYEKNAWASAQVLPVIEGTCMSVQFSHIFSGGYAAGYYSYKWSEVLAADAFSLFKEQGVFNTRTAALFRQHILSKGGTEHPMTLYKRFRGREPEIDALLIKNGIKQ